MTSHEYEFDRQQLEIDMIKTITKPEFMTTFNMIFFSKDTKRIDYELMADAHKAEQDKERAENMNHEVFKSMSRIQVKGSLMDFKKSSGMHAN